MNCRKTVFSILNNLSKTASALVSLLQSQTPLPVSPLQKLLEIAPAKAFQYLLSRLSALLQAFKGISILNLQPKLINFGNSPREEPQHLAIKK